MYFLSLRVQHKFFCFFCHIVFYTIEYDLYLAIQLYCLQIYMTNTIFCIAKKRESRGAAPEWCCLTLSDLGLLTAKASRH